MPLVCLYVPERSGMWIACFNIRMKVVLNVKVSCTVGVGTDQNPVETKDRPERNHTLDLL